jgi:hypothetical protein
VPCPGAHHGPAVAASAADKNPQHDERNRCGNEGETRQPVEARRTADAVSNARTRVALVRTHSVTPQDEARCRGAHRTSPAGLLPEARPTLWSHLAASAASWRLSLPAIV